MKPEGGVSKFKPVLAKDDHCRNQGEHVGVPPQLEEGKQYIWLGGTGPRLTDAQKKRIRVYCVNRDGPKCMICGRDADTLHLEIDHINGDACNNSAANLRLAHHSCNSRAWNRSIAVQKLSGQPKREKGLLAPQLELEPTSPEVRLNREYEPPFRRFCFQKVRESKISETTLSRGQLRLDARDYVGCSQQTSYSYMERFFSSNGPFVEKRDVYANTTYIDFRDAKDVNLTLEDLEAKYPKEGRIKSAKPELR